MLEVNENFFRRLTQFPIFPHSTLPTLFPKLTPLIVQVEREKIKLTKIKNKLI